MVDNNSTTEALSRRPILAKVLEEGLLIMITNVRFQGQATAWVNEGIQVAAILGHLKQHSATLNNEILGI